MAKLTDKQEKFVQELIKGKTQREAYKNAYPSSLNYKDNVVDVRACELLKNSKVAVRYNKLKDRLIKEAEDECIISVKEVLGELKRIGFADIKDYLSFKTVKTVIGHDKETGEPIIDYAQVVELNDSKNVDGKTIQEVSINSKGTLTFKLYDKLAALDKLGKYLGIFKDKLEISGQLNNPFEGLSTEELKKLIQNE